MDTDQAKQYLKQSLAALQAYRAEHFCNQPEALSGTYWLDLSSGRLDTEGTRFLITAWWRDSAFEPHQLELWDYFTLEVPPIEGTEADYAVFEQLCACDERLRSSYETDEFDDDESDKAWEALEDAKDEAIEPLLDQIEPWPLFKYHPLRFRKMSSLAPAIDQIIATEPKTFYRSDIVSELHSLQNDIVNLGPAPLRDRRCCVNPRDLTYGMLYAALAAGDHAVRGNAIYEFPSELIDRFKRTDITKVPLSEIRLPYSEQFVYFTPQPEYEMWPGWFLDGAYVGEVMGSWNILFTAAPASLAQYHRASLCGEPTEHLAFAKDQHLKLLAGEAVEQIISELSTRYRSEVEGTALDEYGRRSADVLQQQALEMGEDKVRNVQARNARIQLERLPHSRRIWGGALKLLLNALMYLTHYPDDNDKVWSPGTPKFLLHKLRHGTRQEREKASRKLAASGHSRIILTGRRLREQLKSAPGAIAVPGDATYVSGHWQRFAIGAGRLERRWQWVMPYVRNENSGTSPRGHIYLVDSDEDPTLQ